MILQGCKELMRLGFRECVGFEVNDKILKLASYIRTFEYKCSRAKSVPPDDDGEFEKMCLVGLIDDDCSSGYELISPIHICLVIYYVFFSMIHGKSSEFHAFS